MQRRSLLISLGAGFAAVIAAYSFITGYIERKIGDYVDVPVIIAKQDIPQNARITENMLEESLVPKKFVQPGVASISDILNHYATSTILKGEQILSTKLALAADTNLAFQIPAGGYRAVTIGVRDSSDVVSVGGLVTPGSFVDVLLTLSMNTKQGIGDESNKLLSRNKELRTEVRTLFQNVRVLAVGVDYQLENSPLHRSVDNDGRPKGTSAKNVTVALLPRDVQKMILAQTVGRLNLSLRRFKDDEIIELPIEDPISAFNVKLPIAEGPTPSYREIRGSQVINAY